MWLCTDRRLRITSSAWLGRISVKRGWMEAKYGAFWAKSAEKIRWPWGSRDVVFQRSRTRGMRTPYRSVTCGPP